jgi:hypothetical protein
MKSLSHWNHRVIVHSDPDGTQYVAIHEIHYTAGRPVAYTENPTPAMGEDVDGLRWQLKQMLMACEAPLLKESDFADDARPTVDAAYRARTEAPK